MGLFIRDFSAIETGHYIPEMEGDYGEGNACQILGTVLLGSLCCIGLICARKACCEYFSKKKVDHIEVIREEDTPFLREKRAENQLLTEQNQASEDQFQEKLRILERYPDLKEMFITRYTEMAREDVIQPIVHLPPSEGLEEGILATNSALWRKRFCFVQLTNRIDEFIQHNPDFAAAVAARISEEQDQQHRQLLQIQFTSSHV